MVWFGNVIIVIVVIVIIVIVIIVVVIVIIVIIIIVIIVIVSVIIIIVMGKTLLPKLQFYDKVQVQRPSKNKSKRPNKVTKE